LDCEAVTQNSKIRIILMAGYDKYYQTTDLFGEPYPELIEFFARYEPKGKVIVLGRPEQIQRLNQMFHIHQLKTDEI